MNRVVTMPRRRAAPKPAPVTYAAVGSEERAAADALLRKAAALQRMLSASFVTGTSLAQAPRLIAEAECALAELKELLK